MQITSVGFSDLPFSELFKSYIYNYPRLSSFYKGNPLQFENLADYAKKFTFRGDRSELAKILSEFNSVFDLEEPALSNIEKLKDNAITVVTGQQLGIYGGPLYTVYKAITAIFIANKLQIETDRPVIPVFWLADEDHDFEEIADVLVPQTDHLERISLEKISNTSIPVADMNFPEKFVGFREQVKQMLPQTGFSDQLWDVLDDCFRPGVSFRIAFGQFIAQIFSKHGMILAGSNSSTVKNHVKSRILTAIERADDIGLCLDQQSEALGDLFHQQALADASLLFMFDNEHGRRRLQYENGKWSLSEGESWSTTELKDLANTHPEKFSPNVFLRPILQDTLLPNIIYVAGPGEIAYYGQMKKLYELFDLPMSFIVPRLSATIVESPIERVMKDLPFEYPEYIQRIEDLESQFISRKNTKDIDAVFEDWKKRVDQIALDKGESIQEIDASLYGVVKKTTSSYHRELDKLKGKVIRAVKEKNEVQIKRIHKIHSNLFPDRSLQERAVSFIYFMNKYGVDIWDQLIEALDDPSLDSHKLIYL